MKVYMVEVFTDLCSYNEVHLFRTYEKALACWNGHFEEASQEFFPDGVPPKEELDKLIHDGRTDLYAWDVEDRYKHIDGYPDDSRTYLSLSEQQVH